MTLEVCPRCSGRTLEKLVVKWIRDPVLKRMGPPYDELGGPAKAIVRMACNNNNCGYRGPKFEENVN